MFRYFIRISWTHFDHLIRSKTTRNSEILFWMTQNNQNQTTKGTTRTTKLNATKSNQVEDSIALTNTVLPDRSTGHPRFRVMLRAEEISLIFVLLLDIFSS
uniref:Uncharacterized protein n=1 Tax=Cacopsylla melanoneura TaxID=428564 RepID=A0A8D8PNZ4_9HEMI